MQKNIHRPDSGEEEKSADCNTKRIIYFRYCEISRFPRVMYARER